MTILQSFNKNPNIGLYVFSTDKYVLVGKEIKDSDVEELKRVLNVPVHQITIAGTSLLGVFIAGNEDIILVPFITFDSELEKLKELNIKFEVFQTNFTCLGNNMIFNDKGCLVSKEFSDKEVERLRTLLDMPVRKINIADTSTPGASIVINGEKAIIHRDATPAQVEEVEKILQVITTPTTINLGVPYVKSGIICNKFGLAIGEASGPAEIMYAESGLGFVDD